MAWTVTPEQRASYQFLLQWILIATLAGVVGAAVLEAFRLVLSLLASVVAGTSLPPPLIAAAAAILVGLGVYRISPDAAGEGMPSYLYGLSQADASFPLRVTLWKLPAALLTIVGFGCGGVIGPVGRTVSGLMSLLGASRTRARNADRARIAAICGMAATIAALLHAPVAGGIFAVEIIQRANMKYRELFPAVLAGAVSVWCSRLLGWQPLFSLDPPVHTYAIGVTPWLLLFAILIGLASGLYVRGYAFTVRVFRRDKGRPALKVLIGMLAAVTLVWVANLSLSGTSATITDDLINGRGALVFLGGAPFSQARAPIWAIAIGLMVVRALGSCLTTGSGMSAGLTGPSIQIGLFAGLAAASIYAAAAGAEAGFPSATPEGLAFLVVGVVGMLAGAMNVPIAAAVLGVEIFGIAYGVPAIFASVIAFQLNRHETIYDYALAGSGHLGKSAEEG